MGVALSCARSPGLEYGGLVVHYGSVEDIASSEVFIEDPEYLVVEILVGFYTFYHLLHVLKGQRWALKRI